MPNYKHKIGNDLISVAITGPTGQEERPDPRLVKMVVDFFAIMAKAQDQGEAGAFHRCFEAFSEETDYHLDQKFLKALDPDFAGTIPGEFEFIMSKAGMKKPKKR